MTRRSSILSKSPFHGLFANASRPPGASAWAGSIANGRQAASNSVRMKGFIRLLQHALRERRARTRIQRNSPGGAPMFTRNILATLAFLAATAAGAAAPLAKTPAPGYFRMMIGDIEVTAISDGTVDLPVNQLLTNT